MASPTEGSYDITASAGPSNNGWSTSHRRRNSSSSNGSVRQRRRSSVHFAPRQDDTINGVSLGAALGPIPLASRTRRDPSADITSLVGHQEDNADCIILASPEELQRNDYFDNGAGPSRRLLAGRNDSLGPAPSIQSSALRGGSYGEGSGSDFDLPLVSGTDYQEDEMAGLRSHPAPHGKSRQVDHDRKRSIGFAAPQVVRVSSPVSFQEDVEDATRPRSSADLYARQGISSRSPPRVHQARESIGRISQVVRRASRRVISMNNAHAGPQMGHFRLPEATEDTDTELDESDDIVVAAPTPATPLPPPALENQLGPMALRGKSLGFMGPENKFRKAMAKLLAYWWIEPLILALIVANAVFLVIQSARDVFSHPRKSGYFDHWEDVGLLAIFGVYTVEIVARIVVSGLVINPPQLYSTVASTSQADLAIPSSAVPPSSSRARDMSEVPRGPHGIPIPPTPPVGLVTINRRQASRSNTLDAWAELGGSLRERAGKAMRPHEAHLQRTVPTRKSTSGSRMSLLEPEMRPIKRSETVQTMATSRSNAVNHAYRPSQPTLAEGDEDSIHTTAAALPLSGPVPRQDSQETSKIVRSITHKAVPFGKAIVMQRAQTPEYAYLRHSWNRVDIVAVVSFWIMFALAITGHELTQDYHIYVFRALSVLRVARLLTITSGTSTILQSLKLAAPLLANVLFFTVFAMILAAIIGIQSFKGSYRRSCTWYGDLNAGINSEPGSTYGLGQICGGWIDQSGARRSYISANGIAGPQGAKGFICPVGQMCMEAAENPYSNSQSFDNIFTSLLEVVIVISSNGWSGAMYNMVDADYFAASLYFIVGIIFLNFWLANLFVAVISNCFATISAQTHQSAFAAKDIDDKVLIKEPADTKMRRRRKKVANVYKRVWGYTKYIWLAAIIADLGSQATRASYDTDARAVFVSDAELYFTIAFDTEIVLRFLSYLLDDDWRSFYAAGVQGTRNRVDTGLCVITTIIQIPAIKNSRVYAWMTIFQLQRFYRVIIAIPRIENLLLRVFGSFSGLLNMIGFLLMIVGLAALFAVQMFRGDLPTEIEGENVEMTFKQIYNGYLAMYQIFSSENWNNVLFNVLTEEAAYKQAVLSGIFLCGWFLFANFIVLQMFIAVINEGFSISEAEMKKRQLEMYVKRLEPTQHSPMGQILHRLSPYRYLKDRNAARLGRPTSMPPATMTGTTDGVRRALDKFDEKNSRRMSIHRFIDPNKAQGVTAFIRRLLRLDNPEDASVPMDTVRQRQFRQSYTANDAYHSRRSMRQPSISEAPEPVSVESGEAARAFAEDRRLRRMRTDLGLPGEKPTQREIDDAYVTQQQEDPRIAMARAINKHPSYDKTLWLFSNHSKFRRFCQSLVPASHGERIFGRQHSPRRYLIVQIVIFLNIAGSVVVAGVASPLYRKDWYGVHGFKRDSWFSLSEVFLSFVFFVEFFVKIVADGFAFTPNAYLLSPWNLLDLLVLASLVVNVTSELVVIGGVSRFTRALKAFRALRLINLSRLMKDTFANLVIGGGRFVDAAILAVLYIIPFAVWGQILFAGLLYSCNDDGSAISVKADCVGEYSAQPSEWTFLAPRSWQNPADATAYSFDDFKSSLLILFEIVSLEGWTNVMSTAMAVVGRNQQPVQDASAVNALFFVIYNLIGAVFVLTLFVSVIIEGFQSATGAAFFSSEQRQWIDLKRLISRQAPAKRPAVKPSGHLRAWCFARATKKHGYWGRMMTLLLLAILITLCTQSYTQSPEVEKIRDIIYLIFAFISGCDVAIRLVGLGWYAFRRSWWCVYDLIMVIGIVATTLSLLSTNPVQANVQLQKFFLTAATLKLVAKNNGLNQLFKTAISGFPAIASLLGLWLCFFLFFGLMFVEIFGLTKWGFIGPETYAKNFSSLPLALIFLSMMSTGEGWNGYMHDYTVEAPICTSSSNYLESDCGSVPWAYALFIAWNVTSMYIILNCFTGVVVENFSYIFQLGGKPVLTREDIRSFKKAWLQVAGANANLPKDKTVAFLRALPGVFEVQIYPEAWHIDVLREAAVSTDDWSRASINSMSIPPSLRKKKVSETVVSKLRAAAGASSSRRDGSSSNGHSSQNEFPTDRKSRFVEGINLSRLRQAIERVDHEEIEIRRERFNRIYHEVCLVAEGNDHDRGISFGQMLTLIAHYKLIDDDAALTLEELVERRRLNERIDERLDLEKVRGVMRMSYLRYRFKTLRSERLRAEQDYAISMQDGSTAGHSSGGHRPPHVDVNVPTITLETSMSPVSMTRERGEIRPTLQLDTSALRSWQGDGSNPPPRTPPAQTGPGHMTPGGLSPLQQSPFGGSVASHRRPSVVSSGAAEPTMEEIERRASPLLEQFDESAWGKLMNRMSSSTGRRQGPGAASSASAAVRTRESSVTGHGVELGAGHEAEGSSSSWRDSDRAWAEEQARREAEFQRRYGDDHNEKADLSSDGSTPEKDDERGPSSGRSGYI